MRATLISVAVALATCTALASRASAQGAVSVTVVAVEGDALDAAALGEISAGVLDGARGTEGFVVFDSTSVGLTETMLLIGCSGVRADCMAELARSMETDRMVFGYVRGDAPAVLELTLYDARSGQPMFTAPITVPAVDAREAVAARAGAYFAGQGVLAIDTLGAAEVSVDGTPRGPAPVVVATHPGEHEVVAMFPDGRVTRRTLVVSAPLTETSATLVPRGRAPVAGRSGGVSRGPAIAGSALLVAAAAAGVVGVIASSQLADTRAAFDETPLERESHDLAAQSRRQAHTANVSLATAGVLGMGGAVVLVTGRQDRERQTRASASTLESAAEASAR
ncbi:MAG: hypothetical protein H6698_01975 [Myxococcales bacterium]|nr:hypothetical protein [Myxococcales bacterium]